MIEMSVVFPAPFGPRRARISPSSMSRLTFLSATKPDAYVFERFWTDTIGVMRGRYRGCRPSALGAQPTGGSRPGSVLLQGVPYSARQRALAQSVASGRGVMSVVEVQGTPKVAGVEIRGE